jgi:hypothetical protein
MVQAVSDRIEGHIRQAVANERAPGGTRLI